MQIQWFGLSYYKIQTKDAVILVNPYAPKFGLKAPHFKADILLISQENEEYNFRQAGLSDPFTICSAGEYELKDVFVYALPIFSENKKESEEGAINQYETIVDSTDDENVKDVLQSISDEEKVHVFELQKVLSTLCPDEEKFKEDGEKEVEEKMGD